MHIQYILINIFGIFASPYKVVIVYVCVKLHTKTFYLHSAECRVRESSDEDPQDFPPVPDSNKILVKKNFFCLFSFSFFFGHFPPLVISYTHISTQNRITVTGRIRMAKDHRIRILTIETKRKHLFPSCTIYILIE